MWAKYELRCSLGAGLTGRIRPPPSIRRVSAWIWERSEFIVASMWLSTSVSLDIILELATFSAIGLSVQPFCVGVLNSADLL